MSDTESLKRLSEALHHSTKLIEKEEKDDEGGESGTGGQSGAIEMRMFVETFSLLRDGEKAFGPTNYFDPLAYLAKKEQGFRGELGHDKQNLLKAHPILSQLSKFDGDTPDMSTPDKNPDAQNRYENRLQLQASLQQRQKMSLKPGGG